jgi:hypothetical protein
MNTQQLNYIISNVNNVFTLLGVRFTKKTMSTRSDHIFNNFSASDNLHQSLEPTSKGIPA